MTRALVTSICITCSLLTNLVAADEKSSSMKFTRLSVKDPGINNIECCSFLVPAGWKTEGGVQWFPDYNILANLLMRISDPQTGAAIEFLPVQNFTLIDQPLMPMQRGQNYMGSIVWEPVRDVHTFVQTFYMPQVLRHLQGVRVVEQQRLDKVAAEVARSYGGQSQVVATKVRYQFQMNKQPWEEDVYLTLVFTPWQLGTIWSVNSAYSFRAPQGMLDKLTPVMNTTISTIRLNLDWFAVYQHVQEMFRNRMHQDIRNAAALSQTITRNAQHIRQLYADAYKERQASQDRISESFSEYIRGVDTYKNPYEDRPVQLPAGYNDAWVNAKGEYILSNQAGYNPNVGDTQEWRRINRRGKED